MEDIYRDFLRAVVCGDTAQINELVSLGADVNKEFCFARTPLHEAALHGKVQTAAVLIALGANALAEDVDGCDPRWIALRNGHFELAAFLALMVAIPTKIPHNQCAHQGNWRKGILDLSR